MQTHVNQDKKCLKHYIINNYHHCLPYSELTTTWVNEPKPNKGEIISVQKQSMSIESMKPPCYYGQAVLDQKKMLCQSIYPTHLFNDIRLKTNFGILNCAVNLTIFSKLTTNKPGCSNKSLAVGLSAGFSAKHLRIKSYWFTNIRE